MPTIANTAAPRPESVMNDLLFLSLGLCGFAALVAYTLWCNRS